MDDGEKLKVIDVDTHLSEPPDLWTSRAPASWRDRVPQVREDSDGVPAWVVDNQILSKPAGASSTIRRDGSKRKIWEWSITDTPPFEEVSPASYDVGERLALMDGQGVHAQLVYPNVTGFGAHRLMKLDDQDLAKAVVSIYNDAVGELQEQSNRRLFPQAIIPFWDLEASLGETRRAKHELGLTGITMTSEPHAAGLPDLLDPHWHPLWELCTDLDIPVNFHVGATEFGAEAFNRGVWPSHDAYRRIIVGSCLLELHNARVLANLLASDLPDRYPSLRWVVVESGMGWVPYVIERLEYQILETEPDDPELRLPTPPREAFHRQVYTTFWFENAGPELLLETVGFDNVMFETDFPHPTCLYPNPVEHAMKVLEPWGTDVQRKVLQDNAVRVYNLEL
ncbi:MAG: amidohydrolase [Acidimicrobiales bacterium]|nr:amidohydrolase [Acidimicrobiales bacterium]